MEVVNKKLTQNEFYDMINDFVLDLESFFNVMNDNVYKLLDKAYKEHWTSEQLINEIEKMI